MEGPTITIVFKKAEGVAAGKTFVKYKDVDVGRVTKVNLSENFRHVVITAKIDKSAAGLLMADSKFWIESPRASLSGISGLGTVLSGNYIGVEPGSSNELTNEFTGLEMPPAFTFDEPGKHFVLRATTLGSVGNGSPIYYRQLNVGRVIGYDLDNNGGFIQIEVFVKAPYDKYVTEQTRFWQASGIDMTMGSEGLSVRTQSMLSILVGGIAFETPSSADRHEPAADNTMFTLFGNYSEAMANPETLVSPYVLYFHETLRGLSVGAPVMYQGLPIGIVTAIGLEYDPDNNIAHPRVDIDVYPSRFMAHVKKSSGMEKQLKSKIGRLTFLQSAIDRGVRAQLRTSNVVTGQRFIALDLFPDAPRVKVDWTKSPIELPVIASGMQDLEMKINSILTKVEKMPLDDIAMDMKQILAKVDGFLKKVDAETMPQFNKTIEDLRRVLANVDDQIVGKEAPTQQQMREALQEITKAAQGVSALTDYLEKNPEALIRGKSQEKPR